MTDKTCFNCQDGRIKTMDAGIPCKTAKCVHPSVDVNLFRFHDEMTLPDFCGKHKFKPNEEIK